MPELVHLTAASARRVPWKNGRGVTEEIALGPEGASFERGDFDWRVSKAAVVENGPFSSFPGFDRVLVVTDGDGLSLSHDGGAPRTLRPLEPYAFDGGCATSADLVGGAVRDVNVLTRRGRVAALVHVVPIDFSAFSVALEPGVLLVHALTGSVIVGVKGDEVPVRMGESVVVRGARRGDEIDVRGHAARLLVVSLRDV